MVSKARELLPLPERPLKTTSWSRGISTLTFLRLCSRAPVTRMYFRAMECSTWDRCLRGVFLGASRMGHCSTCVKGPPNGGARDLFAFVRSVAGAARFEGNGRAGTL